MKLPIDIKAVIEAATDIESARNTPVSVSVLIDDTAPGDVAAHVRQAFAARVRMLASPWATSRAPALVTRATIWR